MPITMNREYRNIDILQPLEIEEKENNYIVEGYATTFDKPYLLFEVDGVKYYEVINKHAFDNTDMSDVIMQYDHTGKVLARLSNGTLTLTIDDHGLFIRADLSKSNAAKDLHQEIRNGLITKMSFAFTIEEDKFNKETRTREILKIKKLYDVSAVSIPANQDTEISARSFVNGVIEKEKQELLKRKKLKLLIKLEGLV